MNATNSFPAPWGWSLKIISAVATVWLVGVAGAGWWVGQVSALAGWLMVTLPLAILGVSALFAVRGYEVTPTALLVRRLLWNTRVALAGLRSASREPEAVRWSLRVFGNGGLFSFSGWFWSRALGRYRLFANDFNEPVVLRFADRKVVVHPARPEAFIELLNRQAGGRPEAA